MNTVLIDRYGAPDEVARAVLTFPTSSASSTSTPSAPPSLPPVPRPSGPQARTPQPRWSRRHSDLWYGIDNRDLKSNAFLALPPGVAHSREKLAALLWPEMAAAQARANLRLNVFALRRALAFADSLRLEGDTVALDAASVDVDAVAVERALARAEPDDLATALAGYRGELLAGLRMQESAFEEWLLAERERLRERAIDGLGRLLAHQRDTGASSAGVHTAVRLLAMDPLHESVHRALMRLYVALGRRGDALRQYHLVGAGAWSSRDAIVAIDLVIAVRAGPGRGERREAR